MLRPDVEAVRRYGESHPEAWVDLRFESDPSVRIVALFSGEDLGAHEAALRRLVAHPDRLDVRRAPWPRTRLEEIRSRVDELATTTGRGSITRWGVGQGRVEVRLRADQELLAEELHRRYGDAVDLTVGFLHFPDRVLRGPDGSPEPVQTPERPPRLDPAEIEVLVPEGLQIRSGHDLLGALRVQNLGPGEVVVRTSGRVTAQVVDPDTREVVGGFAGAQTMPLVRFRVPPGGSVEIPLQIGTASPVPRLGYATPPGRWAIETVLAIEDRGRLRTPLLPITVVP